MVDLNKYHGKKQSLSITIDQELFDKLKLFKESINATSLSPLLNDILWEWIKSQDAVESLI